MFVKVSYRHFKHHLYQISRFADTTKLSQLILDVNATFFVLLTLLTS